MSNNCQGRTDGFGFSPEEIAACIDRQGLLSMEIEVSLACNFRCPYCYSVPESKRPSLSVNEILSSIEQAKALGARRIILLGGEPMLHPQLRRIIEHIHGLEMEIELFTNGTNMTAEAAGFMHARDVAVVLKTNTLDRELQNRLTGCERGHEIIHRALENLKGAGYSGPGKRLAISTVICTDNYEEIPELWRWVRSQGMVPYFEMITPQGGARENQMSLIVSSERARRLFEELARIDRVEFDRVWEPQPPLVGNVCKRHQFSCVVTASGSVYPCVGVTIPLGSIRERPLRDILRDSEVLEDLRNYRKKIKEPCRGCDKAEDCYGCRGAAYQLTGDYLASDPLCWHAAGAQIDVLPVDAAGLIPHGSSIRMVDRLLRVGEREAHTEFAVPHDSPFVAADGRLDETAYVEMIAQSLAAWHGFHLSGDEQRPHQGLLLAVNDLSVSGGARAGDRLQIEVRKVARYGHFGVAEGTVRKQDGTVVARSEIKVWQSDTSPVEAVMA